MPGYQGYPKDPAGHERLPSTETVAYPDGSVNVEVNKIGTRVDLNTYINKYIDFTGPASFVGVTTEDYDGNIAVYVFTDGGYGDSVIINYPKDGKATYSAGELFTQEQVESLTSSPLTIGARHGRFNDQKVIAVAGLASVGGHADGSNPLSIAERILDKRANPSQ